MRTEKTRSEDACTLLPAPCVWDASTEQLAVEEWRQILREIRVTLGAASSQGGGGEEKRVRVRGRVVFRKESSRRCVASPIPQGEECSKRLYISLGPRLRGASHGNLQPEEEGLPPVVSEGCEAASDGGAPEVQAIGALLDRVHWQGGASDFEVEMNLLRVGAEVELEGVCSVQGERGRALVRCSWARMTRATPHWQYISMLLDLQAKHALSVTRVARSIEMSAEAVETLLSLPPNLVKQQASRIGRCLQGKGEAGRLKAPKVSCITCAYMVDIVIIMYVCNTHTHTHTHT